MISRTEAPGGQRPHLGLQSPALALAVHTQTQNDKDAVCDQDQGKAGLDGGKVHKVELYT